MANNFMALFFKFLFSTSFYCISQKYWSLTNWKLEQKTQLTLHYRLVVHLLVRVCFCGNGGLKPRSEEQDQAVWD